LQPLTEFFIKLFIFSCHPPSSHLDLHILLYNSTLTIKFNKAMTIKTGILSDTHLSRLNTTFLATVALCFSDCDIIIHAGDLTNIALLDAFHDKTVYCVHGNMCDSNTRYALPEKSSFSIGNFSFGLVHGSGLGYDIENGLLGLFPEANCLIYGHTHKAVIHRIGSTLIINPGSFQGTGRYGALGTYALLEVGEKLSCSIHEVQQFF
jgi:hypothetical protein